MPNRASPEAALHETLSQLIKQGRDREAAELAAEHVVPTTRGAPMPMDPIAQLDAILPMLDRLVGSLDEEQLAAPTPCAEFDVRGVLHHMVGGATMFAAAFRGAPAPDATPPEDVKAAFPEAMADLRASVRSPGALERTIAAPFGEVPGETFARFVALDGLVHGWDIATATGQRYDPPAEVVAEVEAFATQAIAPEMRDGQTFAAAAQAPADAPALTRLVAFTGRQVSMSSS